MAIVDCAYAPFVIVLSMIFIGERMTGLQTAGVGLILAALFMITVRRPDPAADRRLFLSGVGIGIVSLFSRRPGS